MTWAQVRVGDVIELLPGDATPADIVLLETSNAQSGIAYVESKQLDGENHLKVKRVRKELLQLYDE